MAQDSGIVEYREGSGQGASFYENNHSPIRVTVSPSRRVRKAPTVMVAFRHKLLIEGMGNILHRAGFKVIGKASSFEALLTLTRKRTPDLMLVEAEILEGEVNPIPSMLGGASSSSLVLVGAATTPDILHRAMETGVINYLSSDLSAEEFTGCLQRIASGDVIISREIAESFIKGLNSREAAESGPDALSRREREVLGLVAQGAINREIAQSLGITENTVKAHIASILGKLGLKNRHQAAAFAAREGLIHRNAGEAPGEKRWARQKAEVPQGDALAVLDD